MSKYIDAEKLKNIFEAKGDMAVGTPKTVFYNAAKIVDTLPAADVVEVVRCKDCNHYIAGFCTRDINGRTNMFRMGEDDY